MNYTFGSNVTEVCRRFIQSHFDEDCYQAVDVFCQEGPEADHGLLFYSDQGSPALVEMLIKVLQLPNDELRMTSARLLFDMHKRENILFSNALDSYLSTDASKHNHYDLIILGSLSDKNKLLAKMRKGKLGSFKCELQSRLRRISSDCLLKDDPAEPHTCNQGRTYSTREIPAVFIS